MRVMEFVGLNKDSSIMGSFEKNPAVNGMALIEATAISMGVEVVGVDRDMKFLCMSCWWALAEIDSPIQINKRALNVSWVIRRRKVK